jgi:hypothetical protein
MLKIIGIEIIAALAVLIWYEVLCVQEKRASTKRELDWYEWEREVMLDKRRADEGPLA